MRVLGKIRRVDEKDDGGGDKAYKAGLGEKAGGLVRARLRVLLTGIV
jgi:hypothetical protein